MNQPKSTPPSPASRTTAAPIRSMTGFAQIARTTPDNTAFVLTLKSVNHRYLDLQFHLPSGMDGLEMQWRGTLKKHLIRGHVDVRLSVLRANAEESTGWNPSVIRDYVIAFRAAASAHNLPNQPDLNAAFRLPGAWGTGSNATPEDQAKVEKAAAACMLPAIESLNVMREQEGAALAEELHSTLERLQAHVEELSGLRTGMQLAHTEKLQQKMRELLAELSADVTPPDPTRILQEAALLAERSDVEEEMARLRAHIAHFQDLLQQGGEVGKKLDFLLQEMAREANTTLSKTGGISTPSLRITELGLAMKSEIEKAREQVQNIE